MAAAAAAASTSAPQAAFGGAGPLPRQPETISYTDFLLAVERDNLSTVRICVETCVARRVSTEGRVSGRRYSGTAGLSYEIRRDAETGCGALHAAALAGSIRVLRYLLRTPVLDSMVPDKLGRTPLHWAAEVGSVDAIQVLLQSGADVNARDHASWTPLHYAAYQGHYEATQALLCSGHATVDTSCTAGRTAANVCRDERIHNLLSSYRVQRCSVGSGRPKNTAGESVLDSETTVSIDLPAKRTSERSNGLGRSVRRKTNMSSSMESNER